MTVDNPLFMARWTLTWSIPRALVLGVGLLTLTACEASPLNAPVDVTQDAAGGCVQPEEVPMWMTVGDHRFRIILGRTDAAKAFADQLPLTLEMAELNGNEKHVDLPEALPTQANRPGTIRSGDVMLYGARTLVVFYATFSSSYSYTSLGRVEDPAGLAEALGGGAVRVSFSVN